jgi:hypothetical protein
MLIKRQPFGSAVRIGTWLHLALVAFLLFQLFFPGGSFPLVMSLGLMVDWLVGALYSRDYLKTWPVSIFGAALGGLFSDLFARAGAALAIGIFFFFFNMAGSGASFTTAMQIATSAAGTYLVWGAFFGAVGAAYSLLRSKDIINGAQTLILFVAIASLWISQYTYDTVSTVLEPGLTPAILNWIVAGFTVLIALYIPNKTDAISARDVGRMLILMLLGFFLSLAYSAVDGGMVRVHGFPFGLSFSGWQQLTILMNLLFWFNIAFLLTSVRIIAFIRSYSRE